MPFIEAIERAGSFEALRSHLRDGKVLARHEGLYVLPETKAAAEPGDIPRDWWAEARIDPDTGRVIFPGMRVRIRSIGVDDVGPENSRLVWVGPDAFALGIHCERTAVETLFPFKTVAQAKPDRGKRGPKPYDLWPKLYEHLQRENRRTGKKFSSFLSAAQAGIEWLTSEGLPVPTEDTVRKKIQRERPDLVDVIK